MMPNVYPWVPHVPLYLYKAPSRDSSTRPSWEISMPKIVSQISITLEYINEGQECQEY